MSTINTVPKLVRNSAIKWPTLAAQYSKDERNNFQPISYAELQQNIYNTSAGLLQLGVKRGDLVGLIADNRKEWLETSFGIMAIGAADVPRGCDATSHDLEYILSFTECKFVVTENEAQVKKIINLQSKIPTLEHIISFDEVDETVITQCKERNVQVTLFSKLKENGKDFRNENQNLVEEELERGDGNELACVIFTSGTTGEPKGVMTTHSNLLAQFTDLTDRIYLDAGDKALSVLPVWHSFERSCEYVILIQGGAICYSKPIGNIMLPDLQAINPHILPAVPRVFEAVYEGINRTMRKTGGITYLLYKFFITAGNAYSKIDRKLFHKEACFKKENSALNWIMLFLPWIALLPIKALGSAIVFKKIRAKLGNSFRGGVSGGGALPAAVDNFFWTIGINLVEGYGLTETSPIISVRPLRNPIFGTIGKPLDGVEVKIVGEQGEELPVGQKGLILVRGGIVMRGYYKKDELTNAVIDKNGWFNTGDLGLLTIDGEITLHGRIKDTIVLRSGENLEPVPIEQKMMQSRFISQIVVLGQDQRHLGALIVPEQEEVRRYAKENNISFSSYEKLLLNAKIKELFETEIKRLINAKNGFRMFERIFRFSLVSKPFSVGKELSAKQEVMRHKIADIYPAEMKELFD